MNNPRILWADLHNHNEIGYGKGTLARSYQIARSSLDVYALTIHGFWPDPPATDPKLVDYHTSAFDKICAAFPRVVAEANRQYEPGQFVTFPAYEWHSTAWGDYVVLFPGNSGGLHRARNLDDLREFVRAHGALMIPHHVGYKAGWRGLDWSRFDVAVSPLVEIFSEHGNSFERDGPWPMLAHSMGGATFSQTIMARLATGAHFGFTGGTDTHFGHPGSHGEGITGIYCDQLTREAVFAALRQRRTLAGTGDRIELRIESEGALPGDILPAGFPRVFRFSVDPLAPLDYVEVIKNGRRAQVWPHLARPASEQNDRWLVRVEWGWGRMDSPEDTSWRIQLEIKGGELLRMIPCLSGAGPAVEKTNLARREDANKVIVESFTSRRNPQPINGVVLEVAAQGEARLECSVQAEVEGKAGGCELAPSFAELQVDDIWGTVLPHFSSPRIRLGRALARKELALLGSYLDPEPGSHDTYVWKARQANGHTVWASPYLFAGEGEEVAQP